MSDGSEIDKLLGEKYRLLLLEGKVDVLADALSQNTKAISEMVEVWKSAKHLVAFIFLCAKLGAAISLIWGYFHWISWMGNRP